jgi:predicted adenine nucleotide alpha hydrolase (AANH) superfamily ATPase
MIKSIGEAIGKSVGIPFYYQDFRSGWKEGIEESKRLELYRQQYCGCIYSEKERYLTVHGSRVQGSGVKKLIGE